MSLDTRASNAQTATHLNQGLTKDRELGTEPVLVDLSQCESSADAIHQLEFTLDATQTQHCTLNLNTGNLLLSGGVMKRMKGVAEKYGNLIHTLYSVVPQTQQLALDEGMMVRRQPESAQSAGPIRKQNADLRHIDFHPALKPKAVEPDEPPASKATPDDTETVTFKKSASDSSSKPKATLRFRHGDKTLDEPIEANLVDSDEAAVLAKLTQDALQAAAEPEVVEPEIKLDTQPIESFAESGQVISDEVEGRRVIDAMDTLLVKQTLRSGQVLEAEGSVVLIGDAHSGSEIIAQGDIVVWGVLGGLAHAGVPVNGKSSQAAEIRALRIEAVQLRVGNLIARRPDRLFKTGGNDDRNPEIARIEDNEIRIYKEALDRNL